MILVRGALLALCTALLAGLLAACFTLPAGAALLEPLGIDMRALRPVHTAFGAIWIMAAALAGLAHHLRDRPVPRASIGAFAIAAAGIALTVPLGFWSGREYVGFHPIWAIPIAIGWIGLLPWALPGIWKNLWNGPVYRLMWVSGLFLFVITFAEQFAWLHPDVFADPIVDRRVQLKACGTLVGAINFLVYGTLLWMGEQRGNRTYALSGTAWALWYVSAANTGLNYIHHTYHLPQDHGLKWLGFAVSMTELVVLAKTLSDLRHPGDKSVVGTLLSATKGWTLFVLVTAITISIPPINALVHGTYAVAGHAMAGMVGIDTMAMLAVMVYLLGPPSVVGLRRWVWATNVGLFGFVGWLHAAGTVDGVTRYLAGGLGDFSHRPAWLAASLAPVLLFAGTASFLGFVGILSHLLPAAFGARLAPPSRARAEASARESRSAPLSGKRAVVGPAQALGQAMVCGGDPALRDQQAGELEELGRQRE